MNDDLIGKLASRHVLLDCKAFEHARIDAGLQLREVARRMAWRAGSLSNLLTLARRGQPMPLDAVCLAAFALGRNPVLLMDRPAEA